MSNYVRARITGATYFFTVTLVDRSSDLLIKQIDVLRSSMRVEKARHPFAIDAIVVLPDHLHAIWTLPPNDGDYSGRWARIKARFSGGYPDGRAAFRQPAHQARARHLAAAVLGARHPR